MITLCTMLGRALFLIMPNFSWFAFALLKLLMLRGRDRPASSLVRGQGRQGVQQLERFSIVVEKGEVVPVAQATVLIQHKLGGEGSPQGLAGAILAKDFTKGIAEEWRLQVQIGFDHLAEGEGSARHQNHLSACCRKLAVSVIHRHEMGKAQGTIVPLGKDAGEC